MPAPGDQFDRFVVEEELGRGGMAAVFRVRHATLGSAHALKVLDVPLPAIRARLVQEGRLQAQLGHPNIVAVTDLIEVEGAPGLIMELVAGPSLDVWLRGNRASPALADALFRGILDGVGYAHRQGLVHRDLKPANVLLLRVDDRLVPKVADFGLAKVLGDGSGSGTRTGFAMGTPGYMAPEQMRNAKDVDGRADVFALGCILYELWTGRPAFPGHDLFAILPRVEARDYPRARAVRPEVPEAVERAIAACLEPDPSRRLPSCESVRAVLDGLDPGVALARGTLPAVSRFAEGSPGAPPPFGSGAVALGGGVAPATYAPGERTDEAPRGGAVADAVADPRAGVADSPAGPARGAPLGGESAPSLLEARGPGTGSLLEVSGAPGATRAEAARRVLVPGLGLVAAGVGAVGLLCAGALGWGWYATRPPPTGPDPVPVDVHVPDAPPVIPEVEAPAAVAARAAEGEPAAAAAGSVEAGSRSPTGTRSASAPAEASPTADAAVASAGAARSGAAPGAATLPAEASPGAADPSAPPPSSGRSTPATTTATFEVAGDADAAWLEAGGRRVSAGRVAAGTYAVKARFGEAVVVIRPSIVVAAGQVVRVTCSRSFSNCEVAAR